MQLKIEKRQNPNTKNYDSDDLRIVYKFAAEMHKEFGQFIKAVVVFGSTARKEKGPAVPGPGNPARKGRQCAG